MSRFGNLEFEEHRQRGEARPGEPVRDAAFFTARADGFWLNGDFEAALRHYSRALEKNNTYFTAWRGQAWMLIELGEYPEAMVWTDRALEFFPEHPELFSVKAVACARDANMDKAMAWSDNAMAKEQVTAKCWLARAEVMLGRKSRTAETCIANAVNLAGNDLARIRLQAGRILNRFRRFSAALEHLRQAVTLVPQSALAWYELGEAQAQLHLPGAAEAYEQALHIRPDWSKAEKALAKTGQYGLLKRFLSLFRR